MTETTDTTDTEDEVLFTTQEFADELGITTQGIHNAASRGTIKPTRKDAPSFGGNKYTRQTIEDYVAYLADKKAVRSHIITMTSECTTKDGFPIGARLHAISEAMGTTALKSVGFLIDEFDKNRK